MASLSGRQISSTYKDILHVYNGTENQGLEGIGKRVFDGEGVGSPLYLGTDFIEVGTVNADNSNFKVWGDGSGPSQPYFLFNTSNGNVFLENGDLSVDGKISAKSLSLVDDEDVEVDIFTVDINDVLQTTVAIKSTNIIETSAMIKVGSGANEMKITGSDGRIARGSDKGNIELKDDSVSLQKNGVNLFEAKENGVLQPKTITALNDLPTSPSPSAGSLAVKIDATSGYADLWINL